MYRVSGPTDNTNPLSSIAVCESGDFVLGGGFSKAGSSTQIAAIQSEQTLPLIDLSGWNSTAASAIITGGSLTGWAVCFDNSPPH